MDQYELPFLTPAEAFERDHSEFIADVRARPVRYADHPKVSLRRLKFLDGVKQEVIDAPTTEHPAVVHINAYRREDAFRARHGDGRLRVGRLVRHYQAAARRLQRTGEGIRWEVS